MTWWAEWAGGRRLALWLVSVALGVTVLAETPVRTLTNQHAARLPSAHEVFTNALPAWMELSVLATNAAEWKDLAATWLNTPEAEASPMENFTMPVEHYDDGRIRAILHAGRAAVGKKGLIWAWEVSLDFQDQEGGPDGRIEAANCLYDRNTRRGYCPGSVRLYRTNVVIHGTGMYWVMGAQRMQVLSNAMVYLPQMVKLPAAVSAGGTGRHRTAVDKKDAVPAGSGGGATK
jgi:hypothetical protein